MARFLLWILLIFVNLGHAQTDNELAKHLEKLFLIIAPTSQRLLNEKIEALKEIEGTLDPENPELFPDLADFLEKLQDTASQTSPMNKPVNATINLLLEKLRKKASQLEGHPNPLVRVNVLHIYGTQDFIKPTTPLNGRISPKAMKFLIESARNDSHLLVRQFALTLISKAFIGQILAMQGFADWQKAERLLETLIEVHESPEEASSVRQTAERSIEFIEETLNTFLVRSKSLQTHYFIATLTFFTRYNPLLQLSDEAYAHLWTQMRSLRDNFETPEIRKEIERQNLRLKLSLSTKPADALISRIRDAPFDPEKIETHAEKFQLLKAIVQALKAQSSCGFYLTH